MTIKEQRNPTLVMSERLTGLIDGQPHDEYLEGIANRAGRPLDTEFARDNNTFGDREPERKGDWLQCWAGGRFWPGDPRPEEVNILDIAHALGHASRYGGHCPFYSVAEHSVLVSLMVPAEHAFAALMHDAAEAYVADMIRPVKMTLGKENPYFAMSEAVDKAVFEAFSIPYPLDPCIKAADNAICIIERRALMPRAHPWNFGDIKPPEGIEIKRWSANAAAHQFLARFSDLTGFDTYSLQRHYSDLVAYDDWHFSSTHGGLREARSPSACLK